MDHALHPFRKATEPAQHGTRYFWVVCGLSVSVFAAWMAFGLYYNSHHDTKDAPLRVVIWIVAGLASDVVIWAVALVVALTFSALRRRKLV